MDKMEDNIGRIVPTKIMNPYNQPLTIISGEVKELNNKKLHPGTGIKFMLSIPVGFKEYTNHYIGPGGVPTTIVGWISEDFDEYI